MHYKMQRARASIHTLITHYITIRGTDRGYLFFSSFLLLLFILFVSFVPSIFKFRYEFKFGGRQPIGKFEENPRHTQHLTRLNETQRWLSFVGFATRLFSTERRSHVNAVALCRSARAFFVVIFINISLVFETSLIIRPMASALAISLRVITTATTWAHTKKNK